MNLDHLSAQEKLEVLKLLKQKELLQREKALDEVKLNVPQTDFHQSKARIRLFAGGNGSGKTFALIHELVRTHLQRHQFRDTSNHMRTWLMTPDLKKAEDYLDIIKKICPPSQLPQTDKLGTPNLRRLTWPNGSTTTIYSFEQDSMAAEGTNFDALFWDEPGPRQMYIAAYRGLRSNPDHFVCMALTGVDEAWIYQDIYLPGINRTNLNIHVTIASTYDNKENLSEAWIVQFKSTLTEDEQKVRIHGGFAVMTGRVFKEFDRRTHVVKQKPWPVDWPVWCCIDPHTRKQSVALWAGVTKDDELVVLDEAEADNIEELGIMINQIEKGHKWNVVSRAIDNSGNSSDWAGNTAVDILREKCGLRFSAVTQEEKSVDESIYRIKQLLRKEKLLNGKEEPRLFFMENCTATITEMEMYGWKNDRNPEKTGTSEKIKKVNDDHIDPLRYIVMKRPVHSFSYDTISYSNGYTKANSKSSLISKLLGNG